MTRKLGNAILDWARRQFVEELNSNFHRVQQFDSPWSLETLAVLRRQPPENIKMLATLLPLGVFWEGPEDLRRRAQLPPEERQIVQQFRDDYDRECREHFDQIVQRVARRDDRRVAEQFKAASRRGAQMIPEIASQWNWRTAGAAPGEWGLIFEKPPLRFTISINLAREMTLSYDIGIFDTRESESIRFHDNYLGVLGLGRGEWEVASPDEFPTRLIRASEFARWHMQEYERLIEALSNTPT